MKILYDIVIVGGGLAGLTCALHLAENKQKVLVIEKNEYPHHKVCGEYVSNEVLGYLESLGIKPLEHGAKKINKLQITTIKGKSIEQDLPLGGFGLSRFYLDNLLAEKVQEKATILKETVTSILFTNPDFDVSLSNGNTIKANHVIGAFGKRSNLDKQLNRKFIFKKTSWLAIKAHYKADFPNDLVALHHFKGGYCGLSKVEDNNLNMCYLATYKSFRKYKSIPEFEQNILSENPFLKDFLKNANPIFDKPLSIGQISFAEKQPVEGHILMIGDSAGLIHPLCGNGMAMAVHSAKIAAEVLITAAKNNSTRKEIENEYTTQWNKNFKSRLQTGRFLQFLFMQPFLFRFALGIATRFKFIIPHIIKRTHGKPIACKS